MSNNLRDHQKSRIQASNRLASKSSRFLVCSLIAIVCSSSGRNPYHRGHIHAFVIIPRVTLSRSRIASSFDSSLASSVNSNNAPRRPPSPGGGGTRTTFNNRPPFSSSFSPRPSPMRNTNNKFTTDPNRPPLNDEIKHPTLRVTISGKVTDMNKVPKDEPLGIMSKAEALIKAKEMGNLDLILINENSDPPVAKIADYSKYRYEKEKKAKEVKKNNKSTELKEIKMSYSIDTHDYDVRVKAASKFIMQGNRVKCSIQFKGREIQHDALGYELLNQMAEDLKKICTMEGKPKREGKTLSSILTPKTEVLKTINDKKRAEEKLRKKKKAELKRLAAGGDVATVAGVAEGTIGVNGEELLDDDDDDDDEDGDSDEDDEEGDTLTLNLDDDDDDDDDVSLEDLLKTDKLTGDLFA